MNLLIEWIASLPLECVISRKLKSDVSVYHRIAWNKTTPESVCELYCDLILDIDIGNIRKIIFCNYLRPNNLNLIKKYCGIAIEKNIFKEYAHKVLCQTYVYKVKDTSLEHIRQMEEHFVLSGSKSSLINGICDFFKPIDANKYKCYLMLGSQANINSCTNRLGLVYMEEKRFPEALEQFVKCLERGFYISGLNLANYYIEVEPNDTQVEKYFELVIAQSNKYLKKVATQRYIKWLDNKKKDFAKAETLLVNLDQSVIGDLCWYAEHYFRARKFKKGARWANKAIELFDAKPDISIQVIKQSIINCKSMDLTTCSDSCFPIGLWVYRDVLTGGKFKEQLNTCDKIAKFYDIFENLVARCAKKPLC